MNPFLTRSPLLAPGVALASTTAAAAPVLLADNASTVALWHMDAVEPSLSSGGFTSSGVADDDANAPGRDQHLLFGQATAFPPSSRPGITSGGGGVLGEAISLDGDDIGFGIGAWQSFDSIYADFYFQEVTQDAGAQVLVEATSNWNVQLGGDEVQFIARNASNAATVLSIDLDDFSAPLNGTGFWRHVVAQVDTSGAMSLELTTLDANLEEAESLSVTGSIVGGLLQTNKSVTVGANEGGGGRRFFTGLMDEVYVGTAAPSVVPEPATAALLAAGGLLLTRRRSR